MTFEQYLISKKIDSSLFKMHEKNLWESWGKEFDQVSPVSFTAQKLYLINPIRRRFPLPITAEVKGSNVIEEVVTTPVPKVEGTEEVPKPAAAKPSRPVFKPKPKTT